MPPCWTHPTFAGIANNDFDAWCAQQHPCAQLTRNYNIATMRQAHPITLSHVQPQPMGLLNGAARLVLPGCSAGSHSPAQQAAWLLLLTLPGLHTFHCHSTTPAGQYNAPVHVHVHKQQNAPGLRVFCRQWSWVHGNRIPLPMWYQCGCCCLTGLRVAPSLGIVKFSLASDRGIPITGSRCMV